MNLHTGPAGVFHLLAANLSMCRANIPQWALLLLFTFQEHLLLAMRPKNSALYLHISDQRVRGWLLLDNYPPTFALTVMYLLIVWTGPKYMKRRQPYSCRGLLVLYNLGLTLLSFYMFYEVNRLLGTERCVEVGQSNRCNVTRGTDDKRQKRKLTWICAASSQQNTLVWEYDQIYMFN